MMGTVGVSWTPDTNTNTNKFYKNNNTRIYSPIKEAVHRDYSPLRETPREYFECLEDSECHDELFLLPEQVLDMDSIAVREDLSAIVPSFRRSPHNSLDSEDSGSGSGKSLKLLEDSDGICLARASDDCRTFWLSESSSMAGVGELPPMMSQSMTGDMMMASGSPSTDLATSPGPAPAPIMSQSMMVPSSASAADNDLMTSSTSSLNMRSGKKYIPNRSRADLAAREREREERVRRLREAQEDDRRRKLEELKQHALQAQKFREQQEAERRRHIESLRSKDMDRRQAVEERRREIESKELERKEAIIARNRERETRVETQRRSSRGNMDFAFGSSAPRMMEPRVDSASGYWGTRSASGQQMFERSSASVDRETQGETKPKRTASAHGLNMTSEGDDGSVLSPAGLTAHRRRTDLVPTIVMPRTASGAATPGSRHRSPGISRENSTASAARPGSALSGSSARTPGSGVRLRSAGARRPRPMSIATTGMTSSMYEERQKPALVLRDKSLNTPKVDRMKRARSVTSDSVDNEDTRSVSSVTSGTRTPSRKTPSQVKAENAARKSKTSTPKLTSTPKSSLGNVSNGTREAGAKASSQSKTPSPAMSQDNIEAAASETKRRQSTPDIIKDNNRKNVDTGDSKESSPCESNEEKPGDGEGQENGEAKEQKRIITSEEEAKARIAEKRREMKEQKEREAEIERLRLEEEARQEAERLRLEEEEEKRIIAMENEARRAEEERIRKAIEEKEAEDRKKREEEERLREEKEEMERKVKAEAERREAELQEKLKKEEEERLARKKRIEEIMARTRGKGGATPKKEEEKEPAAPGTSQPAPAQPETPQQPPSLDTNVDPTTPDLLGDIGDKVEENNARNLAHNTNGDKETEVVEKGALDSISSKSDENENSSPLISVDTGDSAPVKKLNGLVEGGSFDQILDLGDVADSNKGLVPELPSPMMAFEESIQQQSQSAATADLLS